MNLLFLGKKMSIDLNEFHQAFFEESLEILETMEHTLLQFNIASPVKDHINQLFRSVHTIKGNSATFGFNVISEFSHAIETLIGRVRSEQYSLTEKDVSLLLQTVDCIRAMIVDLQNEKDIDQTQSQQLCKILNILLGNAPIPEASSIEQKKFISPEAISNELTIDLGQSFLFEKIHTYYDSFLKALELMNGRIILKADELKKIDISGLQLLSCFIKTGKKQNIEFQWQSLSPELQEYIELSGFSILLVGC